MPKYIILLSISNLICASASIADESWIFPTTKNYPTIQLTANKIESFVPVNWKIIDKAIGDLNGDSLPDCAMVLKGDYKEFKQRNTGLGEEIFNTNPHLLVIAFKSTNGKEYKLAVNNKKFIPIPDSPVCEPFKGISIKNGILNIDFTTWASAGSWSASDTSYKFRWQKNKFVLIGAKNIDSQRNTGEQTIHSYNFLTGKEKITKSFLDKKNSKTTYWKNIKSSPLKTLDSFNKPYEWEVTKDEYL